MPSDPPTENRLARRIDDAAVVVREPAPLVPSPITIWSKAEIASNLQFGASGVEISSAAVPTTSDPRTPWYRTRRFRFVRTMLRSSCSV